MFPQKFIALQIEERYETNVGLAYQLHSVMVKKTTFASVGATHNFLFAYAKYMLNALWGPSTH